MIKKNSSGLFLPFILLNISVFLFSCKKDNINNRNNSLPEENNSIAANYQLVWSDEFSGTSVDATNWNFETGAGGWGNNEKQFYQEKNAVVANGLLKITAKKPTVKFPYYTSSRMTTKGKREFLYGKMEARIKVPLAQGLWPAFWMLGSNISSVGWPSCGETDIMEHINSDNLIYGTIHWNNNGHAYYGGNAATTPASYHIYSVEWDSAAIRWYIDGIKYWEANILNNINGTDEFHKPFFLLLNLAIGGDWPGQTIDDSKLPASMFVDYVRVYKAL